MDAYQSLNSTGYLGMTSNDTLNIITNDTPRVTILSGGNVGIGTTSPLAKVSIVGATGTPSATNKGILQVNSSNGVGFCVGNYASAPYGIWLQSLDERTNENGGTTYPLILNPLGGNVGIGTSSPNILNWGSGNTVVPYSPNGTEYIF